MANNTNPKNNANSINHVIAVLIVLVFVFSIQAAAKTQAQAYSPENMPVKEITVFKDGHVFVLHEGMLGTDKRGNVVLDHLPRPIIGTFWAYSADDNAKLSVVVSGRKIVTLERTALEVREMLEANKGAKVRIREDDNRQTYYEATILEVPVRSSEELEDTSPPGEEPRLGQHSDIVLLKVSEGIKAVEINRIREVTFINGYKDKVSQQEFRNLMTLKLDWGKKKIKDKAKVGMMYVERGIRWIPNYHIDIDGAGNAVVKLQATLINELADIEDIKAHLVIGVPRFAFEDTVDPISLQQTVANLSRHFRQDSQTAFAFSNAIMSQRLAGSSSRIRRDESGGADVIDLGPEVTDSLKNEDLYVFTLDHVTLKKGQRMVVQVAQFELKYRDVFSLDMPFGPPTEVRHRLNTEQQVQLARMMGAPKVKHLIRLKNDSEYPLTTAPALIFREGRIIAQGMTTYTPIGGQGDLELTVAVDISVENKDTETERIPNAENWNGNLYSRSNLTGKIKLTNRREDKVYLEITRSILGHIDKAGNDGKIEHLGFHEGGWLASKGLPQWWYWHRWDWWWYHFNAIGQVKWQFELEADESVELQYDWHYFWRL